MQLGGVMIQNGKPVVFYSNKFTPAQNNYAKTVREVLSIVETLKGLQTILFGQRIDVYKEYKNITYEKFTTKRVLLWILLP